MNWNFTKEAIEYIKELASGRGKPCYIKFDVDNGGTPTAKLSLNFVEDIAQELHHFYEIAEDILGVCDLSQLEYLDKLSVDYKIDDRGQGELEVRAPVLYGNQDQWTLVEKINQFIAIEISPYLESHNGSAKVIDINSNNEALLEFAGGCQGCSLAQVTLKSGIEKKIIDKFPEITKVLDYTDHQKGQNPYYSEIAD